MAQKRGFNFSLARHYDKAIAVMVLVALLLSLLMLARSAAASKERKHRYEEGVNNMRPKQANLAPQVIDPYEAVTRNLRHPQAVRASTNEAGLFIPQRRVWCVDCMYPIQFAAAECPYCRARQPSETNLVEHVRIDSEGRGIPDKWRVRYFNHAFAMPEDRSRAEDDADSDGFTNLQEFQAETSPRDPKDHPDLMALLRFKENTTRAYPFVFMGASKMPGGSLRLTFNMKGADSRTYFTKMGEEVGKTGLVYSNCTQKTERVLDPKVGVPMNVDRYEVLLLRPADGKTFLLKDNEPRATMEQELVLTLTAGARTAEYRVSAGGILDVEGQKYKVDVNLGVDDKPTSVVLENILTGKKSTVSIGLL
ncbi:MAG: Amuc_1099 family pilus-like system protein [bacterium]